MKTETFEKAQKLQLEITAIQIEIDKFKDTVKVDELNSKKETKKEFPRAKISFRNDGTGRSTNFCSDIREDYPYSKEIFSDDLVKNLEREAQKAVRACLRVLEAKHKQLVKQFEALK